VASLIELSDINQFLPADKLRILESEREPALEDTAKEIVFSKLGSRYSVDEWLGPQSTPNLIRSIMGMIVAGYIYDRQYGEDADGESYGSRLIQQAYDLLRGLVEGSLSLGDETPLVSAGSPSYKKSEPVFVMGKVF